MAERDRTDGEGIPALLRVLQRAAEGDLSARVGGAVADGPLGEVGAAIDGLLERVGACLGEGAAPPGLSRSQGAPSTDEVVARAPIGLVVYGADGQCVFANEAAAAAAGGTLDQLLAQNLHTVEAFKPAGLHRAALTALERGETQRVEFATRSTFGRDVKIDCQLTPLPDGSVLFSLLDVRRRMEREAELQRFQRLLDEAEVIAGLGSWEAELGTDVVTMSRNLARMMVHEDASAGIFANSAVVGNVHPEDVPRVTTELRDAVARGEAYEAELRGLVGGAERRLLLRSVPPRVREDGVSVLRGTVQDVTELRRAEAEHRARALLLDSVIDQNPYAMWISDARGTMVRANRACTELLRFTEAEALGVYNMFDDNLVAAAGHMPKLRAVFAEGRTARFDIDYDTSELDAVPLAETARIHLEATVAPVRDASGKVVNAVVMHRDVTGERRALRQLEAAKEYAERLIDAASAMIVVLDGGGELTVFNRAAEEVTGYTRAELGGPEWFATLCPKERYPEIWERRARAYAAGELPTQVQTPILTKDGRERVISWQMSELTADGERQSLISYGVDVTERLQLEEQLRHAQRLEAVGQLAGGVAHDFNNMLGVILGYVELLKMQLHEGDERLTFVDEIQRAGERSRDITSQLLAFSRRQIIAPRVVDLNELVAGTSDTLVKLIGEDIELRFIPGEALWRVRVDPSQIDQVLVNLVLNSRDAMPRGGRLLIETANVTLDDAYCAVHLDCRPGSYAMLAVSDDGEGMDAITLQHIFEPFFTTKRVGEGTGLGLATVYGIVRQNGGFINVYSEPSRGTTFKIYLQRVDAELEGAAEAELARGAAGDITVLLVEDDPMVRRVTEAALAELGYAALAAETASDAIALAKDTEVAIDVLLTDVVMPQMNGPELHARVLAERPGVAAIYMSGYTENVIVHHGVLKDQVLFLQKPFAMAELDARIHEALSR